MTMGYLKMLSERVDKCGEEIDARNRRNFVVFANGGTITAQAGEGNAIGFHFGAGATTPLLLNTGTISAGVATETNHDATGMLVDVGANLPIVTNSGLMSAQVRGYDGDAVAFRDLSGTVTNFTNTSRISAGDTEPRSKNRPFRERC